MKFPSLDRDLLRTVLFSFTVVLTVVGIYQTILQNDLVGNYWIFMLAIVCLMLFRRLKPEEEATAKPATGKKPAGPKAKPGAAKRRR